MNTFEQYEISIPKQLIEFHKSGDTTHLFIKASLYDIAASIKAMNCPCYARCWNLARFAKKARVRKKNQKRLDKWEKTQDYTVKKTFI